MTERIAWTTERRRLGDLVPWPRNPRQIKREQAARLVESYEDFDQVETIAVGPTDDGGRHPVYNGHQRLNVWRDKYGPDFVVDVRVASRALSEKEREKLTVFLHRGAAGEWNFDLLANEFEFDELVQWGFDEKELLGLDFGEDEPAEDPGAQVDKAAELLEKWGVKPGDLWELGEHRLICGDCTDPAIVARVMQGEKADCTVTDPPYGVGVDYTEFNDTPENVKVLIEKVMPIIFEHLPAAFTPGVPAMWDYPRPAWVGAWVHPASTSSGAWGFVGSNPILYYGKDPYLSAGKGRRDSSLVLVSDRKGENDHPVSKPLNVWEWLVERMTPQSDAVVFDPFAGSGTTGAACERLGRRARMIEIDPKYCAVILERLSTMTTLAPRRIE